MANKNYIVYSILGDVVEKHIKNKDEIIHYYLAFSNGEKMALFEIASEPIVKEIK